MSRDFASEPQSPATSQMLQVGGGGRGGLGAASSGSSSPATVEWMSDKDTKTCLGCDKSFGVLLRKHHCRCCGRIFCDACSPHRNELPPAFELKGPQRTCDSCHANLQRQKMEDNPTSVPARPGKRRVRVGGWVCSVACASAVAAGLSCCCWRAATEPHPISDHDAIAVAAAPPATWQEAPCAAV